MARKSVKVPQTLAPINEVEFSREMTEAYIQFGAYDNKRTIPNVLDGLKMGARRILWSMLSVTKAYPDSSHVTSASPVGDVMGKFHPHGDSAVYETIVTMAHVAESGKPLRIRVPLIDGDGNWGDLDDEAAAMRYTKCRLGETGALLLGRMPGSTISTTEIYDDAVPMVTNYSGELTEPTVLPSLFPNWVVNGVNTAVGTAEASRSPSHPPIEALNLAELLVKKPAYLDSLTEKRMEIIRRALLGPDFPCDAIIHDDGGIEEYMRTGRGHVVMRAKYEVDGDTINIVGFPFSNNKGVRISPTKVVESVKGLIENGWFPNGIDVSNTSGEHGDRVTIECFAGSDPEDVMNTLFWFADYTGLQSTYPVYAKAQVNGKIRYVGTIEAVGLWLDHRRRCIVGKTKNRLAKAQRRLEIVNGYLLAIPVIQEIVKVIRESQTRTDAADALMAKWGFTNPQCQAILDMTVGQLVRMNADKYHDEKKELEYSVAYFERILIDKDFLDDVLIEEIRLVKSNFDPALSGRRCEIVDGPPPVPYEPAAATPPAVEGNLVMTTNGFIRWAMRRNVSLTVGTSHVSEMVPINDQMYLDAFSNFGYQYRIPTGSIPEKMVSVGSLCNLDPGERILYQNVVANDRLGQAPEDMRMVFVTNMARIKVVDDSIWNNVGRKNHNTVLRLAEGEEVIHAFPINPATHDIGILTYGGRMLRLDSEGLVPKGRAAAPIPAMRMDGEDGVVWAGPIGGGSRVAYWTDSGNVGWITSWIGPDSAGRNTRGSSVANLKEWIVGATSGMTDQTVLRWYDPTMDAAQSMELSDDNALTTATDRRLTSIEGFSQATSVWLEAPSE